MGMGMVSTATNCCCRSVSWRSPSSAGSSSGAAVATASGSGEARMFALGDILLFAAVAGVLTVGALAAWPWGRARGRFAVAGVATLLGFAAWNLVLNATDARGFNVDAPVIPLSWQDAGSGVLAFTAT